MKLLRVGPAGQEKPALLADDGSLRDLSAHVTDITVQGLAQIAGLDPASLPEIEGNPRLGVPLSGIGKIICVGLNYRDHAAETGAPIPKEPILFSKAITALSGPNDDLVLPPNSQKTDWEAELGVIIGKTARYVSESGALDHVAGYCTSHDVSEREFQNERGGQWVKGKSCDTYGPLGPWFVTKDEISDPQALKVWCDVNGERRQDGTTADMIFGVAFLVSYISQFMTLAPGDVISTGTPAGVGLGMQPPQFLKPGDEVRIGVEGLGEQRQQVRRYDA